MVIRTLAGRLAAALVLCSVAAIASAQKRGGDIVMAQQAQPPTLDVMTTTAQATRNVGMLIFETLVTRDENGNVVNDLAAKVDASADGRVYTFTLREGVRFHNGKEMTSADVKASLERYGRVGASPTLREVESIAAPGRHQVVVTLKKATPSFIDMLSSPRAPAAIIPAEEAGKDAGKIEIVGTGPFQFVEYRPDSHVKLKRFDGYVPNPAFKGPDGFSGRKTVWVDTATIRFVPEGGARTAGLQSGEFHVLEQMPTDAAKRAASNPGGSVRAYQAMPWAFQLLIFNAALPPTDNVKFRQALQVGLDYEEMMAKVGVPYVTAPHNLDTVFGRSSEEAPKILEIGFGMGETSAAISAANPQNDYLGIEVHTPGVGSLCKFIAEMGLDKTTAREDPREKLKALRAEFAAKKALADSTPPR